MERDEGSGGGGGRGKGTRDDMVEQIYHVIIWCGKAVDHRYIVKIRMCKEDKWSSTVSEVQYHFIHLPQPWS